MAFYQKGASISKPEVRDDNIECMVTVKRRPSTQSRILALLRRERTKCGPGSTATQIANRLGLRAAYASSALAKMAADGTVQRYKSDLTHCSTGVWRYYLPVPSK